MAEQRRLLVTRHAHDGRHVGHDVARDAAVVARAPANRGHHGTWNVKERQQVVVPIERMDIKECRAAGIGVVGGKDLAAGEVVDEPGVDGAKHEVARRRALACAVDVVENPLHLGGREIRVKRESRAGAHQLLATLFNQRVDRRRGTTALPYDGVIDGLAAHAVPDHRGLALVGDADGGDAVRMDAALKLNLHHDGNLAGKDRHGVLLYPTGTRKTRFDAATCLRDDASILVDDGRKYRGGAAVERHDVGTAKVKRGIFHAQAAQIQRHRLHLSIASGRTGPVRSLMREVRLGAGSGARRAGTTRWSRRRDTGSRRRRRQHRPPPGCDLRRRQSLPARARRVCWRSCRQGDCRRRG